MDKESGEAPWWFKVIALGVMTMLVLGASRVLDDLTVEAHQKMFCEQLHELAHYETKMAAERCWVNLSDLEYPMWVPAEWMNVG